jgi:iron complex outermembrane recepter protein
MMPPMGGGFGMGGGGGGGFGMGGGGNRWSISLAHTIQLEDTLTLVDGGPALDRLNGDATGGAGGTPQHTIELEGGAALMGVGFRLIGSWDSGSTVITPASASRPIGGLEYGSLATLNLRAFANFDTVPGLVDRAPLLRGSRLVLRVDNLTGETRSVRDRDGLTPEAFQPALLAPRGRVIELTFRKQFTPPAAAPSGPPTAMPPPRPQTASGQRPS